MTIRYAGNPNGFSFGFSSGTRPYARTRATEKNEAKVQVLSASGVLLQERIGTLDSEGRCWLKFEGEWVSATQKKGAWVFQVPALAAKEDE